MKQIATKYHGTTATISFEWQERITRTSTKTSSLVNGLDKEFLVF